MALLAAGFWHTAYWAEDLWHDNYWPENYLADDVSDKYLELRLAQNEKLSKFS